MPTANTSTIGAAGDHSDIPTWESATDNDLVGTDVTETGELLNETHTVTAIVVLSGATVDATRFRTLTYGSTPYDIDAGTGPRITNSTTSGILQFSETFFRLEGGIRIDSTSTAGSGRMMWVLVADCVFDRVFVLNTVSGINTYGFSLGGNGDRSVFRSCHLAGLEGGSGNLGLRWGIDVPNGAADVEITNCNFLFCTGNAGVGVRNNDNGTVIRNCAGIDSDTDFEDNSSTGWDMDYCASSDTSATGSNSVTSVTLAGSFVDEPNDDYTPLVAGSIIDKGETQSPTFGDFNEVTHGTGTGTWAIGAIDAAESSQAATAAVASATGAGIAPSVAVGSVARTSGVASATGAGIAPTAAAGSIAATAGVATATGAGVAPAAAAGSVAATAEVATAAGSGIAVTQAPGSVAATAEAATATGAGVVPAAAAGSVAATAEVATAVGSGIAVTQAPGSVNNIAEVATATATAVNSMVPEEEGPNPIDTTATVLSNKTANVTILFDMTETVFLPVR